VKPPADSVPGEGIEPSRAEAHGFLRPARLPIPPSRPGRASSVLAGRTAPALVVLVLTVALGGCGSAPSDDRGPRIAFLFDGSSGDADEVTGPALAGLRFAVLGTGDLETIKPQNVGLGDETSAGLLDELAADPDVVAAVVAPWTVPPSGWVEGLGSAGIPVLSLSWAWGPPSDGVWRSLAPDRTREAGLLLDAAERESSPPRCLAGDRHPTSAGLAGNVLVEAGRRGAELRAAGIVDPGRPATASAVAGRLTTFGCDSILWTGGAEALELLLDADPDLLTVIGTSRLKTEGGISLGVTHPRRRLLATCGCADITLSGDPAHQRFVHDYQTESGSAPGPFAVEAYDAGRLLLDLAAGGGGPSAVAEGLGRLTELDGLLGTYRLEADGRLRSGPTAPGTWRAFGSRWLPLDPVPAGELSTLPLAGVLLIVRARARPSGRRSSTDQEGSHEAGIRTRGAARRGAGADLGRLR
jgi:hypothetical protein